MRPVGVAVIGAGYWGPNLARNTAASSRADLVAVCDRDLDRAQAVAAAHGAARATSSLDDVLSDPRVEAVAVATPAATHTEVALAAVSAGRHVLVEKPLAPSLADGQRIVRAAEAAGVTLMCDHTYCYTPVVGVIRQLLESGDLGEIQYVDSTRVNLGLVQPDVDVLWDLAPHDLSVVDLLLPAELRPTGVTAVGVDPLGLGRDCLAYLSLHLPNGGVAHSHTSWLSPTKVRRTVVGGSRRTVVWDDLDTDQPLRVYDRGIDVAADVDGLHARDRISYRLGDVTAPVVPQREALSEVIAEFAGAIREGRPARTDGRAGLRVLQVLEAADLSRRASGRLVPVEARPALPGPPRRRLALAARRPTPDYGPLEKVA